MFFQIIFVINIIYKNTLADGKKSLVLTGKEHYLSTDGCHEILRTLRREVLEPYGAFAVGETVFVDVKGARDLCEAERGELDLVFEFEHMECDQVFVKWFKTWLSPKRLMKTIDKWQRALTFNAVYFENHDQPRFISRFSDSALYREKCSKMMAGLLMSLRGVPFLFEGQEIGMTNGDFKDLSEVEDIESHNIYAMAKSLHIPESIRWKMIKRGSRDNARTPMQWTGGENAGFTSGKPWLKINANHKEVNVEREKSLPDGVLSFYKKMIEMRKTNSALSEGEYIPLYIGKRVFAFARTFGEETLISVMNMTAKKARLPRKLRVSSQTLISNYQNEEAPLEPFEFRLLRLSENDG